jgi:hypothetical protein
LRVNLYTDAPKHNLALMKISAWHKQKGDKVTLNMPIMPCDKSYASILFEKNINKFTADEWGGIAYEDGQGGFGKALETDMDNSMPDYSLFHLDYSLGYTFRSCFRKCDFCKVWKIRNTETGHRSIYDFHNPLFAKICLLNNNTFFDKQWRETFEEIWDAGLTVVDENGYDLRLMDDEKAEALRKTRFQGKIHYAWDRMQDEAAILRGLAIAPRGHVYVLIGYDTTEEQDLYRCQKIIDHGHDPYIMPYNQSKTEKRFKRFIDTFMWRKYKTMQEAWDNYSG